MEYLQDAQDAASPNQLREINQLFQRFLEKRDEDWRNLVQAERRRRGLPHRNLQNKNVGIYNNNNNNN
jgi:hypothetical protein